MKKGLRKGLMLIIAVMALSMCFVFGASARELYTEGYYTYTVVDGTAAIVYVDKSISGDVVIPSTLGGYEVTEIENSAFNGCYGLEGVTITDSVTSIGDDAFSSCYLTSITVDENNEYFSSDEYGVLFNKDKTIIVHYPLGNMRESYIIPDGITTFGDVFSGSCLVSITIPDSVTAIDGGAFYNCGCLSNINLPDNPIAVAFRAFEGTEYYHNENNWYKGALYIGNHLIEYSGDFSFEFKEGVKYICGSEFQGLHIKSYCAPLIIPDTVVYIGSNTLGLHEFSRVIYIPDSVEYISTDALANSHITKLNSYIDPWVNILYEGSKEKWDEITDIPDSAFIHYNVSMEDHEHSFTSVVFESAKAQAICSSPYWCKLTCDCGFFTYEPCFEPTGEHKYMYIYDIYPCSITEATETLQHKVCEYCWEKTTGEPFESSFVTIYPTDHSMSEWETVVEATCSTYGTKRRSCSYGCGYVETERFYDSHDLGNWKTTQKATCSQEGTETRNCGRCDYSETQVIPKKDHTYGEWYRELEPTCVNEGNDRRDCLYCSEYENRTVYTAGHTYGDWYRENNPTCTSEGNDRRNCVSCSHYETRSVAALSHKMNGEYVKTEPTCTKKGVLVTYCTECGYEKTSDMAKLSHSDYDADGYCDICGENIAQAECPCNCHKGGFMGFIWKIVLFFQKLFKANQFCACGAAHY